MKTNKSIDKRFNFEADKAPVDAFALVKGTYYKYGRFNRVFRWASGEWKTTTTTFADIRRLIESKAYEARGDRWVGTMPEVGGA